jgi:hypothetical protein
LINELDKLSGSILKRALPSQSLNKLVDLLAKDDNYTNDNQIEKSQLDDQEEQVEEEQQK